jgi:uncharacterized protein
VQPDITPIGLHETFRFVCSNRVPCFNDCCQNLNQLLTPYDILRLKNHLGITSRRFLEKYTSQHDGPETGLPVISLKPADSVDLKCPFVTPEGCRVYPDRPSSCRIYPLARAITRNRDTGELTEHFACLKESHCLGHKQGGTQTVQQWVEQQGLRPYITQNDRLIEIIALKNQLKPGPLDLVSKNMLHLALYDLDGFREKIFQEGRMPDIPVTANLMTRARDDDSALLQMGYIWIEAKLFGKAPSPTTDSFGLNSPNK